MIHGFKLSPGQDVGEFLLDDEQYNDLCNRINNTYPDRVQLGGILGTPDEPELDVLTQTFGDSECKQLHDILLDIADDVPCFEGLDKHEEGGTDAGDVPMAEAQIDEGVGATGGVDVAVRHIVNENERTGPIQVDGVFVVHGHKQITIAFCESMRFLEPSLMYGCISIPALILLSILLYFLQDVT
jgi:hypothetical protein